MTMDVIALQERLNVTDRKIERELGAILEHISDEINHESASAQLDERDELLHPDLLKHLSALMNGIQEAEALFEEQRYIDCLEKVHAHMSETALFDSKYPNSLLVVDITRRSAALEGKALDAIRNLWNEYVDLGDNHLKVNAPDAALVTMVLQACPQMTQSLTKRVGSGLITPIIEQTIELISLQRTKDDRTEQIKTAPNVYNVELTWKRSTKPSLELLFKNMEGLVTFCASLPTGLNDTIPRFWGSHLVHELVHTTIPRLYPDRPTATDFKKQLQQLKVTEKALKENGWVQSNEISQFLKSFDSRWPDIRREKFLTRLRELYKASEINVDSRSGLIGLQFDEENIEQGAEHTNNDWEWNSEDEDDDEGASRNAAGTLEQQPLQDQTLQDSSHQGSVIELWKSYFAELGNHEPEDFFLLFRALVDLTYNNNYLWIYADTHAFAKHVHQHNSQVDTSELEKYAHSQLPKYVRSNMEKFDHEILPILFNANSSNGLKQIKTLIDEIAIESNEAGGPELREYILSQLVEQTCVFIIQTVVEMKDIADEESISIASMISQLQSLAVYFANIDVNVPSWTKMEKLGEILSGNLTTIKNLHESGMLADFSPDELRSLIKALFVDSAVRDQTIRSLYDGI